MELKKNLLSAMENRDLRMTLRMCVANVFPKMSDKCFLLLIQAIVLVFYFCVQ